jgi:two-component system OmpR family response regulator
MDGEEGDFLGDTEPYDAVVLDLGLPRLDGLTVLKRWRAAGRDMPVLILTARDGWSEKVAGLNAGADDYLAKPFVMAGAGGAHPRAGAPCAWPQPAGDRARPAA